ncbi:MAG: sugar kinase [Anaerolineaceae bacterium]|nr:sugar kinase [Anaerolineaceae bacterium]
MVSEKKITQVEILGIGDAMVDLTTRASQLPPRGGNIWSTAVTLSPGGTTANVAAGIARLGLRSSFIGCVGDDPYGRYTIEQFQRVGVDTSRIRLRPGAFTGIVLAIVDDTGERTFIACAKGASHTLLDEQDFAGINFKEIPIIHSTGVCLVEEPSRSVLLKVLEQAHQTGCNVFFDPNLRLEGNVFRDELRIAQWKAFSFSDVVLIGDNEVELMFPGKTLREAAGMIRGRGAKIVVVKQGEKGASVFSADGEESCPAFQVNVNSTTGAGDSFNAGFIAARVRGASLRDALVYACAVAGLKVTGMDARSVPTHQEVMAFLAQRGFKLCLMD